MGTLRRIYRSMRETMYQIATVISPRLNTKMRYREKFGENPDLKSPKTFNEKLLWLKLNRYMRNPLVIQCADKYRVREYITACGYGDILNDLLGVWDSPEEIPWNDLPEKFALKWNFGAGMNVICSDKSTLDIKMITKQMKKWGKRKYWLNHSELQYKYIDKKIICERFIECEGQDVIPDYKVYCFHGVPQAVLVMHDRGGIVKAEFFDAEWNSLPTPDKYQTPKVPTEKPTCLSRLIEISRNLSEPFPFVRCDFYIVNEKLYFGELTFTPAGGLHTSETTVRGQSMSELLKI